MERGSQLIDRAATNRSAPSRRSDLRPGRPQLALVSPRLQLGLPQEAAPADWHEGLARLVAWLGIAVEFVPSAPEGRLARMAAWVRPGAAVVTFAPWLGWAPNAFQHGGLAILPQAHWVASYLHEQGRGVMAAPGAVDLALLSPHPAGCSADEAGMPPLPRPAVLRAMIESVRAEGRQNLAIIVHARQRNAMTLQLHAQRSGLAGAGLAVSVLAIEEALASLSEGGTCWDAIIAMPDLRSIVFTLLARAHGVAGPWPMLWHGGPRGCGLLRITTEAAGEGMLRPALDAPALIQALALALDRSGAPGAARRLHEAWARARAHGLATPTRAVAAPYVNTIEDARLVAMLTENLPTSQRPVQPWRALGAHRSAAPGTQPAGLRIVTSSPGAKAR